MAWRRQKDFGIRKSATHLPSRIIQRMGHVYDELKKNWSHHFCLLPVHVTIIKYKLSVLSLDFVICIIIFIVISTLFSFDVNETHSCPDRISTIFHIALLAEWYRTFLFTHYCSDSNRKIPVSHKYPPGVRTHVPHDRKLRVDPLD